MRARVELPCPDAPAAEAVHGALAPELSDPPEGARITVATQGPLLVLAIDAEDVGALRAALQTVRLADAALRSLP